MNRWLAFILCVVGALFLLFAGWLVPIHIRAVSPAVLAAAGAGTPSVVDFGVRLAHDDNPGPARLMLEAAQAKGLPKTAELANAISRVPSLKRSSASLGSFFDQVSPTETPLTQFVLRRENRDRIVAYLNGSENPAVKQLVQVRELTNTVIFAPSHADGGQALDAALAVAGLLIEKGHLSVPLREKLTDLAVDANKGKPEPLESALLDVMSLGQRMSWSQLTLFIHRVGSVNGLRELTQAARDANGLPIVFTAVALADDPGAVASYLAQFSRTGLQDIGESLRYNLGGLKELLIEQKRLDEPTAFYRRVTSGPLQGLANAATGLVRHGAAMAVTLKWLAYALAGFLLALGLAQLPGESLDAGRREARPSNLAGIQLARGILFALGFLLVILLLSEPFLAQESQKVESPLRLHSPLSQIVAHAAKLPNPPIAMNQIVITLLLFFVLQALIYIGCLMKLGEIRRQKIAPRMKLKLLENEDHLFDAGLYLGFVGTIISLILVSLGVIKQSLMAGYSSTSFGIIFVCIFKIFQLRPVRRQLLLEAEAADNKPATTGATASPTLATLS